MLESRPNRFTLRKEYFGGLVYDAKTTNYELINPAEYDFLLKLSENENNFFEQFFQANSKLHGRIEVFKKLGFVDVTQNGCLSLVNVRIVPPLKDFPKEMLSAPIRVFDSYTRQCNFDCPQCYFSSNALIEEKRRTLEQTAEIMRKFWEVGTMEWRFTGGEPLVHPDLFDVISIGKSLGMNVGLNTNGWWTEKIAGQVLGAGLDEIVISLEGERYINDQRRKSGSYDKVIETLNRLLDYNRAHPDKKIKITIATTVGRDNLSEVEFLALLAAHYGSNINFMPLKPSGRARIHLKDTVLSTQEYMGFAKRVQQMRQDLKIISSGIKITLKYKDLFCPDYEDKSTKPFPFNYSECGALTTAISLMPDGRVFSCPFVLDFDTTGEFIGPDMAKSTVQEAWLHPNFGKFRNAKKTGCVDCTYYMRQCRGACRATVLGFGGEIKDGKLYGKDPHCFAGLIDKN